MGTRTRRAIRLGLISALSAGVFLMLSAVPGAATPQSSGFVSTLLGHGRLAEGSLRVKPGAEVVTVRNDIAAGASSGWHSHPGGAIVIVVSGQVTTYKVAKGDDEGEGGVARCVVNTYTANQTFVEGPGVLLDAKNTGTTATVVIATFPGVPALGQQRTDRAAPVPDPCPV
jgi:hypothetical protein